MYINAQLTRYGLYFHSDVTYDFRKTTDDTFLPIRELKTDNS